MCRCVLKDERGGSWDASLSCMFLQCALIPLPHHRFHFEVANFQKVLWHKESCFATASGTSFMRSIWVKNGRNWGNHHKTQILGLFQGVHEGSTIALFLDGSFTSEDLTRWKWPLHGVSASCSCLALACLTLLFFFFDNFLKARQKKFNFWHESCDGFCSSAAKQKERNTT